MSVETASVRGTLGVSRKVRVFGASIKIEHSVFALPFAYLALFLVEDGWPSVGNFLWLTVAMIGARTLAMAANRLIDAEIDARNPRTEGRAVPAGLLRKRDMLVFMGVSFAVFLLAVYQLSDWAQRLWPVAVAPMLLYPYLKRFTPACHLGISCVYFIVPLAVWIAVSNDIAAGAILLGLGAGFWVAGFDVIYAIQDMDFDRREGLHSIPANYGLSAALWTAKALHVATVALIVTAGLYLDVGPLYYIGTAAFFLLLVYEHALVSPRDTSRVNAAFFTMNGMISVVFFLFVAIDVLVR